MREILFKTVGVCIIVLTGIGGWTMLEYRSFIDSPLKIPSDGVTLEITPGSTAKSVAAQLYSSGYLEYPRFFAWYARFTGSAHKIKAGEYFIAADTMPEFLLQQIVGGQVVQHGVTIVEGWTIRQLRAALAMHPKVLTMLNDVTNDELLAIIGVGEGPAEGRFMPDTYHFPTGVTDKEFLRRAYESMARYLDEAWAGREKNLPLATPYEALILASIVEKETGLADERGRIAGVFIARLEKGMRLQTDPTVIYGIGEAYDGNIRRKDLVTDTPYNTYTRAGLPPTPIALPGREAIDAVLHPNRSGYLYFVSRGDGSHYFSKTLEEHNAAVRKYQLRRNRNE